MPKTITKQSEIQPLVLQLLSYYQHSDEEAFWEMLEIGVLQQKVKFPLLERIGQTLFLHIPFSEQIAFTDRLVHLGYEGGYVIVGTILANRMNKDLAGAFEKALEYYMHGNTWYVVDIMAHRVHGQGLLQSFEQTLPYLSSYLQHPNDWVKRSVGIAMHLAIKWGLEKSKVEQLLDLALTQANSKNEQIKKGLGWAVKTLARVHPDLIEKKQILRDPRIAQWFKKKVQVGLGMKNKKGEA